MGVGAPVAPHRLRRHPLHLRQHPRQLRHPHPYRLAVHLAPNVWDQSTTPFTMASTATLSGTRAICRRLRVLTAWRLLLTTTSTGSSSAGISARTRYVACHHASAPLRLATRARRLPLRRRPRRRFQLRRHRPLQLQPRRPFLQLLVLRLSSAAMATRLSFGMTSTLMGESIRRSGSRFIRGRIGTTR